MHNIVQTKSRNQSRTINCLQNNQIYNQILQIPNKKLKEDKEIQTEAIEADQYSPYYVLPPKARKDEDTVTTPNIVSYPYYKMNVVSYPQQRFVVKGQRFENDILKFENK